MTLDVLLDHLASEHLDLEAFERRRAAVGRASTVDDLRSLLDDLPGRSPRLGPGTDPTPSPFHARLRPRRALVHSWSGPPREPERPLPERLWVVGALGGTSLDLRDASFPPGPTEIVVVASLGRVRLVLPDELPVEVRRAAFPGRVAWEEGGVRGDPGGQGGPGDPRGPRIRVVAVACMGSVTLEGGRTTETGS